MMPVNALWSRIGKHVCIRLDAIFANAMPQTTLALCVPFYLQCRFSLRSNFVRGASNLRITRPNAYFQ
jgi:hypothetical protein